MKNFGLTFMLLCIMVINACNEKKESNLLTNQAIGNSLNEVETISRVIEYEFNKGMRKTTDRKVYQESQRFKGWRENYLKNKSKTDLLAYSDSVVTLFNKWFVKEVSWDVKIDKKENLLFKQLNKNKQLVLNSTDPNNQQELLFWVLETEKYLQSNLVAKIGSDCRWFPPIDLYLNGEKFKPGDTVYATFEASPKILDGLSYKSDSLFVTNLDTNENISKTIIQSGPYFTIRIIPEQKGTYMINGKIRFYSKLFKRKKVYIDFDKKPFEVN